MVVLASKRVLTVGPAYQDHRGGIGALINNYSVHFSPFHYICSHRSLNKLVLFFYAAAKLIYLPFFFYIHRDIKIIHIHGASNGSFFRKYLFFLVSKYFFAKKVIYHIHSGEYAVFYHRANKLTRWAIRHFIEKCDVLICLSPLWKTFFKREFTCKNLVVLPNLVNKPNVEIKDKRPFTKTLFLFLGKIRRKKGIFDLLAVVNELSIICPDAFELWIGGDGEEVGGLEHFIKVHKLASHVKFLGWVSGERKQEILLSAHVFLLPSYFEGSPVSILEAMSFALPVIATDVGGIPEIIKHESNGFVIAPGDKKSLLQHMLYFINEPDDVAKFGKRSSEIVKKYYYDSVIPQLSQVYSSLL